MRLLEYKDVVDDILLGLLSQRDKFLRRHLDHVVIQKLSNSLDIIEVIHAHAHDVILHHGLELDAKGHAIESNDLAIAIVVDSYLHAVRLL